ncbi:MAG: Gldg family protein, partial [Chitinophagaceae bacterium]|nr:Gldg family protein [Chitinophagaceae bacterium]
IYYLLIVVLFLGFSIIRLNSKQEPQKWTANFSRYGLLFLLVLILGYFTSRPGKIAYLDLTKNKINTLHTDVQDIVKKFDGSPVTVTLYTNLFHRRAVMGLPQNRTGYISLFWERYIRFYPNLQFKYEYYYDIAKGDSTLYKEYPGKNMDEIAAIRAEIMGIRKSLFKKPSELDNIETLRAQDLGLLMELEYKGRKSILRAYEDGSTWPDQDHTAGSLMRLLRDKDVKATFLTGHFERNPMRFTPRDFGKHATMKYNRKSLINKGVDSDTLSIMDKDIPSNLDLLVVADPRSPYSQVETDRIEKYIADGGNAIFYSEPGKQFILAPILERIGVQVDSGMIVSPNEHEKPDVFFNYVTKEGNYMSKEPYFQLFQWYGKFGGSLVNEGAANITATPVDGFTVEPVVYMPGDKNIWIEKGKLVLDSAAPSFSERDGDIRKEGYTIAVKLSRKINNREQRIVVAGDADFMSAKLLEQGQMGLAFYNWCLNNKYPVYANNRLPEDRKFRISDSTATMMINIYVYLIPVVLLVAAIIILVRRKRK